MALANYNDLKDAVLGWLDRSNSVVTARVPDFIRLGEARIWRRVRLSRGISAPTALTVGAGTNYATLPSDFLAFKSIDAPGNIVQLDFMPADALFRLPEAGDPSKYSIEGSRFYYGQTAQGAMPFTMRYYQHPGFLEQVSTTWLMTIAPDIYLFAALMQAAIFIKDDAKVAQYGATMDQMIAEATDADRAAQYSGSRLRMRGPGG